VTEFFAGPGYVIDGFRLILRPGVRLYVFVPLLINALLFAGAIVFGAGAVGDLSSQLSSQWAWADWVVWLLWPLFIAVVLLVGFFFFSVIANLLGAPFNGFLSEAVERSLTGTAPPGNGLTLPGEIVAALRTEAGKFLYFGSRAVPLLVLFLIPFVQVVAPFLWVLLGAWMMALEYLEYPLNNHGRLFPEVRALLRQRRGLALGFGSAVLLLTLIPVLNFVAMPVAVAGATRLCVERLRPGPA
jgi:CysZ protein